jgi:hypothetical protein
MDKARQESGAVMAGRWTPAAGFRIELRHENVRYPTIAYALLNRLVHNAHKDAEKIV